MQYRTRADSFRTKIEKIVLKQTYLQGCKSGDEQEMNVSILVPTVPPNVNTNCNVIKIDYFIRVSFLPIEVNSELQFCLCTLGYSFNAMVSLRSGTLLTHSYRFRSNTRQPDRTGLDKSFVE